MFGIKKLIDAAIVFYTTGYLDIPKLQIKQQALYTEALRQRKMKERFLYFSAKAPDEMTVKEQQEFDYLFWYFEEYKKDSTSIEGTEGGHQMQNG